MKSTPPSQNSPPPTSLAEIARLIPGYDAFATAEDCRFDEREARKHIAFIETYCTHVKGKKAGEPFILENWEKAIVANLFGWKRPDGTRRYRQALIFIPRKNGKSLLGAAIGTDIFFTDHEPGCEIYCAAAERGQAALVWNMARQMVVQEQELAKRCKIYKLGSITREEDGSFFRPISKKSDTKHGFNAHCVLFDELHAQKDSELMDVLATSMGSRTQPLMLYFTTSDYEREGSPCNAKHAYAGKVRDGQIQDKAFLPVIYEAAKDADWRDEKVWAKANPNLGVSVTLEFLRAECRKADESPAYQNTFKRLYLNMRTEQDVRWLMMEKWDLCHGDDDLKNSLLGMPCFGGLDLATTSDLSAFVLYFPAQCAALCWFWVPRETAIARLSRDRINYLAWAAEKQLELTDGNVVDYDVLRKRIGEIGRSYNIKEIAIDRWNSTQLQTQLMGDGFQIIPFGQGFASMSSPTKELEKLVIGEKLRHFGQKVLRWNACNVSVEQDAAGNVKPSKKKSTEKIDGIVSLIMAVGRAMVSKPVTGSIYEQRGLLDI